MPQLYQHVNGKNIPVGGKAPQGNGVRPGMCLPYQNVTLGGSDGRRAIFEGSTEADERYILCDGGDDGFGGKLPNYLDRMIMGAGPEHAAGTSGGSNSLTLRGVTLSATTLTWGQLGAHPHYLATVGESTQNNTTDKYPITWSKKTVLSGANYYMRLAGTSEAPNRGYCAPSSGGSAHTHPVVATVDGDILCPYMAEAIFCFVGE